ncbi:unnamed protein product [Mytilus edulis]|uniref:Uncharacterized protein n=1 Tax=Mytilus edulis TaxID=6550 RepID=A0A8S3SQ49_MYTED|nr:unnamed protein product [Mytilus edulis]
MEYIKKYIDPDYPSFYSDIWRSVDCDSVANFYAGGSDNTIYINDLKTGTTLELNDLSIDSVQTVHTRHRKQSGYSMKPSQAFKFYSNTSTRKHVDGDNNPVSNFKILIRNKQSTIKVKKQYAGRKEYHRRSKRLYSFLKDNIGNEELVETRRTLIDNKFICLFGALDICFVSGSKAEGLDIKGSDTDHMCVIDDADEIDGKLRVKDGFLFDSTSDTATPGYISIRQVTNATISDTDYSSSQKG